MHGCCAEHVFRVSDLNGFPFLLNFSDHRPPMRNTEATKEPLRQENRKSSTEQADAATTSPEEKPKEEEEVTLGAVAAHLTPGTGKGIYAVPPKRQSSSAGLLVDGESDSVRDQSTGESIYAVPRSSKDSQTVVPADDGGYSQAVRNAPVIPAHRQTERRNSADNVYSVPKRHPLPALPREGSQENIYDEPPREDDQDEPTSPVEVEYATVGEGTTEPPRSVDRMRDRSIRVSPSDQKSRTSGPKKPLRRPGPAPVKPVPYSLHKRSKDDSTSPDGKLDSPQLSPQKLDSRPSSEVQAYSPEVKRHSRPYTPGADSPLLPRADVEIPASSDGANPDDDLYAEPPAMAEEVLRAHDDSSASRTAYSRLTFGGSVAEDDTKPTESDVADNAYGYHHLTSPSEPSALGNDPYSYHHLVTPAANDTSVLGDDPYSYNRLSMARDTQPIADQERRLSQPDLPEITVDEVATATVMKTLPPKRKPNPYEQIWTTKPVPTSALPSTITPGLSSQPPTAPYTYNQPGRRRSLQGVPSERIDFGEPQLLGSEDMSSSVYSYATVQVAQKPSVRRPRADTDDVEPPPIPPYAGSMTLSYLGGGDGTYSSIDDPGEVFRPRSMSQQRRSRSLDSQLDILAMADGQEEVNETEALALKRGRLQRHAYEDIDLRPMPASTSTLRTAAAASPAAAAESDRKWKEEIDALRKKRLQHHSYEWVQPRLDGVSEKTLPEPASEETNDTGPVTEKTNELGEKERGSKKKRGDNPKSNGDQSAKPWRRPDVKHNYEMVEPIAKASKSRKSKTSNSSSNLTHIMSTSEAGGEEDLAWDDLEMPDTFIASPVLPLSPYENVSTFLDDAPPDLPPLPAKPSSSTSSEKHASPTRKAPPPPRKKNKKELPPGWEAVVDSKMGMYYYHASSGTTQWTEPEWPAEDGQDGDAALVVDVSVKCTGT